VDLGYHPTHGPVQSGLLSALCDYRHLQSIYYRVNDCRSRIGRSGDRFIVGTCTKQAIIPGQLTVHADSGSSMMSKPLALLIEDLGIRKSHSRPGVSNDNPFSESQFKTMKDRPDYLGRFGSLQDARSWGGLVLYLVRQQALSQWNRPAVT
jgi:transposase InsO family protein